MSEVETSPVARTNGVRDVEVRVWADAEQVPLLRSFAADIAMRLDFDLDAIEDLRMAVDEACSLLVRAAAADSALLCWFEPEEHGIRVRVRVDAEHGEPPSGDAMGWQILTALAATVTETVEAVDGGHRVTVELLAVPGPGEVDPR
ncbi:ATP-binding protein [Actinokineospora terrae]|uniref:Serine/threonine-protein kinase RsbW n=1 Tax=Actinokineospora terrae TaxID=155974 RepID=A0A1H9TKC2_9PSEU|nr:ATP-binding protein [Actinokineospora terrae]SER97444.1 serine/threonine-protein kinase RsbW [Actinokineospora terrae]